MKNIFKILSVMTICMMLTTSCGDHFFDVNTDPNNAATATIDLVFPAGVSAVAFAVGGTFQIQGEFWSQHWTQSTGAGQYIVVDNYNLNDASTTFPYTTLYSGGLVNLDFVSKTAEKTQDWNYFLMAEVMKAYTYQILVDLYDKVPYSEALQGTVNSTPKFDNGQDIYDDLIVRIDAALAKDRTLASATLPTTDDLVFNGDMGQWVKFANTLKLKIFMRQSEVRPAVAQAGIQALYASGAEFLDAPAEMTQFKDVTNFRNPFFATEVSTSTGGKGNVNVVASNTLLLFLQNATDKRANKLFNPPTKSPTGPLIGLKQGDFTNTNYINHDNLSQPKIGATQSVPFISLSESYFLQAEANVRYGDGTSAEQLYDKGIDESYIRLGLTSSDAQASYAPGAPYDYNKAGSNKIESILVQKWVSMANYEGLESYLEQLRTGFPNFFTITPQNVTGGIFPSRVPYPSTELNNNPVKLQEAGGQRRVIEHVWWDPS
jgi:Starch-binding associating with outer membrane